MPRLLRTTAALFACSLILAACSSSHDPATPTSTLPQIHHSSVPVDLPKCKLPKKLAYPKWVPKDLPLPHGIYLSQKLPNEAGYFRGLFVIPVSTTQFAKFVLSKWPKAGYQLGRGDAEPGEVEDQFIKSPAFGAFKAQDMSCSPPHSIMLFIYVPDRSQLPGISSPLPASSPTPSSTPFGPSPTPSPSAS